MRNLSKGLNVVICLVVAIFSAHEIDGWRGCSLFEVYLRVRFDQSADCVIG